MIERAIRKEQFLREDTEMIIQIIKTCIII